MSKNKELEKLEINMDLEKIIRLKKEFIEKTAQNLLNSTTSYKIEYDDLVEEGYEALIKFILKARLEQKNLDLIIKNAMLRYIKHNSQTDELNALNNSSPNLEEEYLEKIRSQQLLATLKEILTPREYYIFIERYVLSTKPRSYEKIGRELNLTHEGVRRIEIYSQKKLKKHIRMQQFNPDYKEKINLNPRVNSAIFKDQCSDSAYLRNELKAKKEKLLRLEAKNQVFTYFNNI